MSSASGAFASIRQGKRSVDVADLSDDIDHDGGALAKRLRAATLQSSGVVSPLLTNDDLRANAAGCVTVETAFDQFYTETTCMSDVVPHRTTSSPHGQLYRTTQHLIRFSRGSWSGTCFPQYFDRRAVPWLDFVYGECARVGRLVAEGDVHTILAGALDILAVTMALDEDFACWITLSQRLSEQSRDAGLVSFLDTLARTWFFLMSGLVAAKCVGFFNATGAWRVLTNLREKLSNVNDRAFLATLELLAKSAGPSCYS